MLFAIVLVLAGLGWWWSGPASDELVLYPARCADGTPILPRALTGTRELDLEKVKQDEKKYRQDRANCVIDLYVPEVFKLNEARGEVYYKGLVGTKRLVDCAIFGRTDWTCSYPDGSGKVVIIDGLQAIGEHDLRRIAGPLFYLRRWQWWIARLWQRLGGQPQGAWLIPEQQLYAGV